MSNSSVITCVAWIRKGEATSLPKYALKEDELKDMESRLVASLEADDKKQWSSDSDDSESDDEIPLKKTKITEKVELQQIDPLEESLEGLEKFNLENYDNEDGEEDDIAGGYRDLASLAVFSNNKEDPYMTKVTDEEDKDEEDDFELRPDDNLIIVGRTEEDGAILEVYVFNEEEDSLYVHHDLLLPSFPLALEPVKPHTTGKNNYVAVGYFTPNIDIWDLNVVDSLEPAFSLGQKKKMKKKSKKVKSKPTEGHTDAVLDLSWNHNVCNILASSSADNSVALWDMESQKMLSSLTHHTDKAQCVEWHPFEGQCLLTGGCDGLVAAVDCQSPKHPATTWQIDGEVEKIIWNHFSPHQFYDNKPSLLVTKEPKMGIIHCSAFCPDNPSLLALGGGRDSLRTFNFQDDYGQAFKKQEHFAAKFVKGLDEDSSSEDG
ncbi:hypothetical protein BSL78_11316 [Apostichopus japonicus]|uniref:Anaphase-promoting complex subunit 4-like WD40 domain-containing protein n=1 Tax=Stichopus japonicus TaxID=307972 RepID=A0A2G8KUZ5_STIJA|nr:hypothetical protein BSL78_11316 [Apostichopus japonicus]